MARRILAVTMELGAQPSGGARAGAADEMAMGSGNWNEIRETHEGFVWNHGEEMHE